MQLKYRPIVGASPSKKGYEVKSNRESGFGRYNVVIIPDDKTQLGILIEFKNSKDDKEDLKKLAKKALLQMESKGCTAELKQRNLQQVLKVAIVFRGKTFVVESKRQ